MTVVVMYSSVNRVDHEKGSGPSKEGVGGRDKPFEGSTKKLPTTHHLNQECMERQNSK